jgi:putative Mg2+ transporter-C (MgtC) family protein
VDPGTQLDIVIRLTIALFIGAIIGIEREYRGHPAGVRTLAMVSVGSCIFTAAGLFVFPGHNTDPTRVAAQVVTGVGFLGAGAIFRSEDGVKGLTTAATVWVVAALGMAIGFGLYLLALGGAVIVLVGLVIVRPIELHFFARTDHPMRRRDDAPEAVPVPHEDDVPGNRRR